MDHATKSWIHWCSEGGKASLPWLSTPSLEDGRPSPRLTGVSTDGRFRPGGTHRPAADSGPRTGQGPRLLRDVRGQRWREIVVGLRGPGAARRVSRLQSESRAGILGPPERHTGRSPRERAGWAGVSAEDERPTPPPHPHSRERGTALWVPGAPSALRSPGQAGKTNLRGQPSSLVWRRRAGVGAGSLRALELSGCCGRRLRRAKSSPGRGHRRPQAPPDARPETRTTHGERSLVEM